MASEIGGRDEADMFDSSAGGLHFVMAADSSECVAPAEINTMLLLFTAKETGGRGRE